MGSGKSRLGPILANVLGFSYADLDGEIEARADQKIAALFRDEGEAAFRQREREALRSMVERVMGTGESVVISLGGGAILQPDVRFMIRATGTWVTLTVSLDDAVTRLRNRTDRPLLLGPTGRPLPEPALRERIARLMAEREPIYAEADLVVATDGPLGRTIDTLARQLAALWRTRRR